MTRGEATYQYLEAKNGNGLFFYTDCCNNRMYSISNDVMRYHGCLCPKCFWHGKYVTLYLRGTEEGKRVINEKWNRMERSE